MSKPEMLAFPDDGFIALQIPREMIGPLPPEASGYLIRFKSAEGFKAFMVACMETAALVWPEIEQMWTD